MNEKMEAAKEKAKEEADKKKAGTMLLRLLEATTSTTTEGKTNEDMKEEDKSWAEDTMKNYMDTYGENEVEIEKGKKMKLKDTTQKQMFKYIKENPEYGMQTDKQRSDKRAMMRKMSKAETKKIVAGIYAVKIDSFRAQKECFKRLFKIHATMRCAAMDANLKTSGTTDKPKLQVKKGAMKTFNKICMKNVHGQF